MSVTCPICESTIELVPNGRLYYCLCRGLGVDHTKEYTRYLGVIPKEHPNFPAWWERYKDTIKLYQLTL